MTRKKWASRTPENLPAVTPEKSNDVRRSPNKSNDDRCSPSPVSPSSSPTSPSQAPFSETIEKNPKSSSFPKSSLTGKDIPTPLQESSVAMLPSPPKSPITLVAGLKSAHSTLTADNLGDLNNMLHAGQPSILVSFPTDVHDRSTCSPGSSAKAQVQLDNIQVSPINFIPNHRGPALIWPNLNPNPNKSLADSSIVPTPSVHEFP